MWTTQLRKTPNADLDMHIGPAQDRTTYGSPIPTASNPRSTRVTPWSSQFSSMWMGAGVAPNKVSNKELYLKTCCRDVIAEIKHRCVRWLGLQMPQDRIPEVALRWTPTRNRKQGLQKITWRRTVEAELRGMDLSWNHSTTGCQRPGQVEEQH